MRRRSACLLLVIPVLLSAASAPVITVTETADAALARARTEAGQAANRLTKLQAEAARAGSEADRLKSQQAAAAAAIEETEAKIAEQDAEMRLARAQIVLAEQRLAVRRAPLAALLAGLATMGRQPPILALADQGSVEEMIRVKALLDATMPVIERRSAMLRNDVESRRRSADAVDRVRSELAASRTLLDQRRQRFAELEAAATDRAAQLAGEAFGAGDRVLASDEAVALASSTAEADRSARAAAARLTDLEFAPARPMRGDSALPPSDFAYSLPVEAPLIEGLGSVNKAGISSRGLRFATSRGAAVVAPAEGEIVFAAPYRGNDGIVIIDHGGGRTSLLLGVSSEKPRGSKVRRGEFIGRALGPLGVELRLNGVPQSPALIAASSVPLSNGGNSR
ncbi:peptidoglycan DD-metalloendopeptidase family protein [Sphingomonas sp. NSE70-1]|uniref:Peptidoglycan DD-metalloendopeptidase family protein n=1 Tax=Sphingomonas caseinilyticus TaxID=2908205 RepID=A0ABT0RW11_9SPHN|nr:peptidoglycan DD-metalloendopeptidase family protein [Sphingomonas caseinilyticus]MCL6699230.1 peptidoglycan DD-metalloendopeptidase family protein [Sphingomonas caseinilyticus]